MNSFGGGKEQRTAIKTSHLLQNYKTKKFETGIPFKEHDDLKIFMTTLEGRQRRRQSVVMHVMCSKLQLIGKNLTACTLLMASTGFSRYSEFDCEDTIGEYLSKTSCGSTGVRLLKFFN